MKRETTSLVRQRAGGRCEYCRIPAWCDPLPFQIDHVVAEQHGGETVIENLAWSCLHCNKHKGPNIAGIDPVTNKLGPLYNPRKQHWERHFSWDGATAVGRTRIGRTTIRVLAMNDPDFVAFRVQLMEEGAFWLGRSDSVRDRQ
ncbi:MAG TPA: HNH endonuclease signature motif containing protein [Planctomycetaceae bacterium]|nr:HNH endonuclease signature motif containing protein [Planctomycetaceae bacterium]